MNKLLGRALKGLHHMTSKAALANSTIGAGSAPSDETFRRTYLQHIDDLLSVQGERRAMELAVGGHFDALGVLEVSLLRQHGLMPHHHLVDVGCGSGRLAVKLREYLQGRYTGLDVVPKLVDYAKRIAERPDWRFEMAEGLSIPEPDASVDFVCFFSVLTHLTHEESFKYLADASRVLKPGGKVVFSFLEFRIPAHWYIFDGVLKDSNPDKVLNQFMDRDAIAAFALRLGFRVEALIDGDKPHIPLAEPITYDDGREVHDMGLLGQSVAVLVREGDVPPLQGYASIAPSVNRLTVAGQVGGTLRVHALVSDLNQTAPVQPLGIYVAVERDNRLYHVNSDGSQTPLGADLDAIAPHQMLPRSSVVQLQCDVADGAGAERVQAVYVGVGVSLAEVVQHRYYVHLPVLPRETVA